MHNIAFSYLKILEIFVILILKLEYIMHVLCCFPLIVGFDVNVR